MFTQLVLVFTVTFTVLPVLSLLPWNDPCNIHPNRLPKPGELESVKITRECAEGEIRWSYPQGTLQVHFVPHNNAPFQVCVKRGFAFSLTEMFYVNAGKRMDIELPSEGHDTCVKSRDGEVILMLVAPPPLLYLTSIDFYMTAA